MYLIGEVVVHPMHGAGRIEEIVEQKISGEIRRYYVLQIPTGNVRVLIPVEGCENIGIRPIIDEDRAIEVLEGFAAVEVEPTQNWNKRYRENMLRLKSGSLDEVVKVVKSLMLREQERGLSTGERKMLSTAKQILISELVLATGRCYEEMEKALTAKL